MTTTPTAAARVSGTIKALEWSGITELGMTMIGTGVTGQYVVGPDCLASTRFTVDTPDDRMILGGGCYAAAKAAAQADYEARILAAIQPDPEPQQVACPECGDTGVRDTGGVHPWGEHISVPCDCTPSSAVTVSVEAAAKVLLGSMMAEHERPGDNARWHNVWREMERAQGYAWNRMEAALRALAGDQP